MLLEKTFLMCHQVYTHDEMGSQNGLSGPSASPSFDLNSQVPKLCYPEWTVFGPCVHALLQEGRECEPACSPLSVFASAIAEFPATF